jgi:hypothetical protein
MINEPCGVVSEARGTSAFYLVTAGLFRPYGPVGPRIDTAESAAPRRCRTETCGNSSGRRANQETH